MVLALADRHRVCYNWEYSRLVAGMMARTPSLWCLTLPHVRLFSRTDCSLHDVCARCTLARPSTGVWRATAPALVVRMGRGMLSTHGQTRHVRALRRVRVDGRRLPQQ